MTLLIYLKTEVVQQREFGFIASMNVFFLDEIIFFFLRNLKVSSNI